MATCRGTRRDGLPCTVKALQSGFCFAHDPGLAAKRQAAYASGGTNKGTAQRLNKLMPASLKPVLATLLQALDETHSGELEPKQASAMASVASAIGRLYGLAEMEQRLSDLERKVMR
jgi:hypothetical protein